MFFQKYMKWVTFPERPLHKTKEAIDKACADIAKRLGDGVPVRANLEKGWHYIGIVGCTKGKDEFLCIEPWSGNNTITYAGKQTRFLTKLTRDTTSHRLVTPYGSYASGYGNPPLPQKR